MSIIRKNVFLILGITVILHKYTNAADYTCGLVGFEPNTASTPHYLPSIPANIQGGVRAWETTHFGSVTGSGFYEHPHTAYLHPGLQGHIYYINTNARTQNFVEEQKSWELYRRIQIKCQDGKHPSYSFIIPIQDASPPEFEKRRYTFNVTNDWSLENPITNTIPVPVIVSKKPSPIKEENVNITISYISTPNVLQVDANSLWILTDQTHYFFRLDLRLKSVLPLGQTRVVLSAIHGSSSGSVEIVVNVS